MAHCEDYIELISAAIDGALSPQEQEQLKAHLAACPDCQSLYDDLNAIHAALADLPPVEVPTGLKDRILNAVAAESEPGKVVPFAPKKPSRRWQRWLASAAVLAVVLMGTWSWKPWEAMTSHNAVPEAARSADAAMDQGTNASAPAVGAADSALTPVTGSLGMAAAPASQPSEAQADSLPEPASAPMDAAPGAVTAEAPAEKSAVRSAKVAPSSDGDASSLILGSIGPVSPVENGTAGPSGGEAAYGYAPASQSPDTSVTEDVPGGQTAPAESVDISALQAPAETPALSVAPRLFSAAIPSPAEEGILEQDVSSLEQAVNVLANYIYEFVDTVEPVADSPGVYTISSPTGVSGTVTCLGEFEPAFLLDYQETLSPQVFHYSVSRSGEVFLLGQGE